MEKNVGCVGNASGSDRDFFDEVETDRRQKIINDNMF